MKIKIFITAFNQFYLASHFLEKNWEKHERQAGFGHKQINSRL